MLTCMLAFASFQVTPRSVIVIEPQTLCTLACRPMITRHVLKERVSFVCKLQAFFISTVYPQRARSDNLFRFDRFLVFLSDLIPYVLSLFPLIFCCTITFPTYLVLPLSINVTMLDYLVNYVPFARLRFASLRFILETYLFSAVLNFRFRFS